MIADVITLIQMITGSNFAGAVENEPALYKVIPPAAVTSKVTSAKLT
jgi:hypothetical protein